MHTMASDARRTDPPAERSRTVELIRAYFTAQHELRKGICLVNAKQFDKAVEVLSHVRKTNPQSRDLVTYLASALAGAGRYREAATELSASFDGSHVEVSESIRAAYFTWRAGDPEGAVRSLRDAVARSPEDPNLHYHLGTMLAGQDQLDEAEMRFTQVLTLQKDHLDGLVSLALCHGARRRPEKALELLERAQNLCPHDARIAMLLAQAAKAVAQEGGAVAVRAEMPPPQRAVARQAIDDLAAILERDPEFAEAFVALDADEVDEEAYATLLLTLKRAVERSPQRANLHYLRGQILARLGKTEEAIAEAEQAVNLDPGYIKALLLLARLYQSTSRNQDAAARLEKTVSLGAEYADTYYLLGNLYRDSGALERARWAYENALRINSGFDAALAALAALAA